MVKKVIIGFLLISLVLMGGFFFSLPYFINKESVKTEFITAFRAATGYDVEISGDVVAKTFPAPHVEINSVYIHNAPGAVSSSFLLTVKLVKVWPAYTSLMSSHMRIGKISVDDADIELERLKNDQMNWRDPTVRAPEATSVPVASDDSALIGTTIALTNGYVHYTDAITSNSSEIKDIGFILVNGGSKSESTMKLDFSYRDKTISVAGKIGNLQQALTTGEIPADLSITSEKTSLIYAGNAGYKDGKLNINGKINLNTDDIGSWINTFMNSDKQPQANENTDNQTTVAAIAAAADYKPLPLEIKSDITTENGKIILPAADLEGTIIKGGMRVSIDPDLNMDIKADVHTLDLQTLFDSRFFSSKDIATEANVLGDVMKTERPSNKEPALAMGPKSFFSYLNISADIKIDDTLYNDEHIKDAHVIFDALGGEMTISQATATLPGDARLVFAGIGKEGFQGFTLEGELDAYGNDFTEAMKIMRVSGSALPTQDFKRFRLKTNATISSRDARFSEFTMAIENMTFRGGFIATFADRTKLNAALQISGMNIDDFIKIWGIKEWHNSLFDTTPGAKYDSFLARWLRRLGYDARVNVLFEKFTLNGVVRDRADFKLMATAGTVELDDIKTDYNGSQVTGSLALDVTGPMPKISIKGVIDKADANTFLTPDGNPVAQPPEPTVTAATRWSHKQFDFHWLELLNVVFDVRFGEYTQGLFTAEKLHIHGMVDERGLNIDTITGNMLGAPSAGKISIKGGKIPSITLAANITSLDPARILSVFPILKGITGKFNLSVRLDTSGIDMLSWVSSLEGSVGVGGEQVDVHGFNLAGVIHAVAYVRTVADILNVVRRAFPNGDTMFSNLEGQWTVINGVLKTANSRLSNEQTMGLMTGQIDLINWKTQTFITLELKNLDAAHPPGMVISFDGDLDHPSIALDTRSLEQYVTNKTSQQMLQQYGTR